MNSSEGLKRLENEFVILNRNAFADLGCTVGLPDQNNLHRWRFIFLGPRDTPYEGGMFCLELEFPKDYPNNAPQIHFLTPIYHLNVCPYKSSLGLVCPNFIKNWNPSITAQNIITKLYSIFYKVNPDSAFEKERANEYLNNRPLYESKIKFFTKKYANLMNDGKYVLDEDWNFSCDESMLTSYIGPKEKNSEIYNKYDGNEQSINIKLRLNGDSEKIIQCQLKEKIGDVIKRFLTKYEYETGNELSAFYNAKNLNMDMQIGYLFQYQENILFTVIDFSDVEFLK